MLSSSIAATSMTKYSVWRHAPSQSTHLTSTCTCREREKKSKWTHQRMHMTLIEIQPVSPMSLVGSASSGIGTYYCLTSFLNDAHHSLASPPKARSESVHWPVSCRTCSCGHHSRWRLLKIDTDWGSHLVKFDSQPALHWFLRYGERRKERQTQILRNELARPSQKY